MGVPPLQFFPCRLFNGLQGAAAAVQTGIHRAANGRGFSGKVRLAECNDSLHDLIFLPIGLFMRRGFNPAFCGSRIVPRGTIRQFSQQRNFNQRIVPKTTAFRPAMPFKA